MGKSLGKALLFFVVCDICQNLVLAQLLTESFCPSVCFPEENKNGTNSSCLVLPKACDDNLDESQRLASDTYQGKPPIISKVKVTSPSTSHHAFGVTWSMPSIESLNESEAVQIKLSGGSTDCQLYDFQHSSLPSLITLDSSQPTFQYCDNGSIVSDTVLLTFTVFPHHISASYSIFLPQDYGSVTAPSSAQTWVTLMAITADSASATVTMVIHAVPSNINLSHFDLHLMATPNNSVLHSKTVPANNTIFSFGELQHGDRYKIRLTFYGPDCPGAPKFCNSQDSPEVLLASLPTTQPPATVQVTESTTTESTSPTTSIKTTLPSIPQSAKTTQATDPSVIVKPAEKKQEYEKSLKIILGTVFGFAGVVIIVIIIVICVYRKRRGNQSGNFRMQRFGPGRDSDSSIGLEDAYKLQPIVLILYSYDCDIHERVVIEFANYLRFVGNCDVIFDVWDQHLVQETSIFQWIQDKVEIADYIIIVCSTGARFKCVRNKHFRMKQDRPIPDYFSWAVDLLGEKIRKTKNDGGSTSRYVVAYFDYAGHSDVPPKLDNAKNFCLMKDIFSLYCHVHSLKPDTPEKDANMNGITFETFRKTEEGKSLDQAMQTAKEYFKENPDWLGKILEPLTPVKALPPPQNNQQPETEKAPKDGSLTDSPDGQKMELKKSPSSSSQEDIFLEERKKRRLQETNGNMEKVISSSRGSREVLSPVHSNIGTPGSQVTPTSSSVSSSSPLIQTDQMTVVTSGGGSGSGGGKNSKNGSQGSLQHVEVEIEDFPTSVIDEEEELQRDIAFIHNFDANHRYSGNSEQSDILSNMELGGYTPPEEYLSLASLVEEAGRSDDQECDKNGPKHFVIDFDIPSKNESMSDNEVVEQL